MSASGISEALVVNVSSFVINTINKTNDVSAKMLTPSSTPLIKKIHDILITTLLLAVMFAMGCSITYEQVLSHLKKPFGVITGMISQFLLLPFSAFCLVSLLKIDALHAAGLLILASSPGGVTSNIFTYFCDGDLSLSVTMTTMSTIAALPMMPFNVWIYGSALENDSIVIPYRKMALSLAFLTAPVVLGMLVLWKFPRVAPMLTKIGSIAGFAIIIVCETLEVIIFPNIFDDIPVNIYIAEIALPLLGLSLGYALGSIFQLKHCLRRTIAIECGIQNVGTALAIVSLSYPFDQLRKVWLFPFLYAFSMLGICIVISVIYQMQKRCAAERFDVSVINKHELNECEPKLQNNNEEEECEANQQLL